MGAGFSVTADEINDFGNRLVGTSEVVKTSASSVGVIEIAPDMFGPAARKQGFTEAMAQTTQRITELLSRSAAAVDNAAVGTKNTAAEYAAVEDQNAMAFGGIDGAGMAPPLPGGDPYAGYPMAGGGGTGSPVPGIEGLPGDPMAAGGVTSPIPGTGGSYPGDPMVTGGGMGSPIPEGLPGMDDLADPATSGYGLPGATDPSSMTPSASPLIGGTDPASAPPASFVPPSVPSPESFVPPSVPPPTSFTPTTSPSSAGGTGPASAAPGSFVPPSMPPLPSMPSTAGGTSAASFVPPSLPSMPTMPSMPSTAGGERHAPATFVPPPLPPVTGGTKPASASPSSFVPRNLLPTPPQMPEAPGGDGVRKWLAPTPATNFAKIDTPLQKLASPGPTVGAVGGPTVGAVGGSSSGAGGGLSAGSHPTAGSPPLGTSTHSGVLPPTTPRPTPPMPGGGLPIGAVGGSSGAPAGGAPMGAGSNAGGDKERKTASYIKGDDLFTVHGVNPPPPVIGDTQPTPPPAD
ncbi:hypothetical protein ACFXGA_09530 [Actinosynnema sp. NPDC059335]|uniref:WXG100 family type VII secretion target n=1 Tax=Actinosynnema sp. NPDC059335 TaxID=3346804 RepID=UPI00366DF924